MSTSSSNQPKSVGNSAAVASPDLERANRNQLAWQIISLFGVFLILVSQCFWSTHLGIKAKEKDSAVINRAGLQRCLIERYVANVERASLARMESDQQHWERICSRKASKTAAQFESALFVFKNGGALDVADVPVPVKAVESTAIFHALTCVETDWQELRSVAERMFTADRASWKALQERLVEQAQNTVSDMDCVVRMFQLRSDHNLLAIKKIQIGYFLAAVAMFPVLVFVVFGRFRKSDKRVNGLLDELQESVHRFERAVAGTSDALWEWDIETNRVWFAPRFSELLGHNPGELKPTYGEWFARLHLDDRQRNEDALQSHLQKDVPYDIRYRMKMRDGNFRWFRVRGASVQNEFGIAHKMSGSIQDIEELVAAEEQLAYQSEELATKNRELEYHALFAQHTDNGIVVTDSEGIVEWVNEAFVCPDWDDNSQAISKPVVEVLHGASADDQAVSETHYAIRNQIHHAIQIELGSEIESIWFLLEIWPVKNESGETVRFVVLQKEITQAKNSELEKKQLGLELQEVARQAGMAEMATGVLHNIGNVLNSVNVSANILRDINRSSPVHSLSKASDLITDQETNLGEFLTNDRRGKHFPRLFRELAGRIRDDEGARGSELDAMLENIEHIKDIISAQQSIARGGGNAEYHDPAELVCTAVKMNGVRG